MKHIELSHRVIRMLLDGDDDIKVLLRKQYESAKIISIESSIAGFYINYSVNNYRVDGYDGNATFQIGNVDGMVKGIEGAVGFILYVKDGYLEMLEGYTNMIDTWPIDEQKIELIYDSSV